MITLGTTKISNIVISTALGFGDGMPILKYTAEQKALLNTARRTRTTILTKSITRNPNKGNFCAWNPFTWHNIKLLGNKTIYNNYKLTNPGSLAVNKTLKKIRSFGSTVIPNIWADSYEAFMDTLSFLDYPSVVEFNLSCPNVLNSLHQADILKAVKEMHPEIYIIAKLGYYHTIEDIQKLEAAGVNAFHMINSIPVRAFNGTYSAYKEGAISGGASFSFAFDFNNQARKVTKLPIIMGCGVTSREHIKIYQNIGADAISVCSWARLDPDRLGDILWEYNC